MLGEYKHEWIQALCTVNTSRVPHEGWVRCALQAFPRLVGECERMDVLIFMCMYCYYYYYYYYMFMIWCSRYSQALRIKEQQESRWNSSISCCTHGSSWNTILVVQHIQTPHLQLENGGEAAMLVLFCPDRPCVWPPQEQSNSPLGAQHHTAQGISFVPSGN